MSREVELRVTITLSDDMKNHNDAANIGENVLIGLRRQAEETAEGLVGDNFDGYTEAIEVTTLDPETGTQPILTQGWDCHSNEIITH